MVFMQAAELDAIARLWHRATLENAMKSTHLFRVTAPVHLLTESIVIKVGCFRKTWELLYLK